MMDIGHPPNYKIDIAHQLTQKSSEGAAAVKKDKNHSWTSQGDQGQSSKVGNQVKVDAHGPPLGSSHLCSGYWRMQRPEGRTGPL